jgi:SAM-dependent methyltransferase
MPSILSLPAWEAMHAPYDQPTYEAVLDLLTPEDIVLDIGAGDLRLARQMARTVRKVYAVEINAEVLDQAYASSDPLPGSLIPICADARSFDFPTDVTVGVLLMRHCTRFSLYFDKLRDAGARRLITNARWRMGVEAVDLWAASVPLGAVEMGWYACRCGVVGFKAGPAEQWSAEMDRVIHEVTDCPQCTKR